MLFVDASVIVAILQNGDGAAESIERLEADGGPFFVSPIVRLEASFALARRLAEAKSRDKPATPDMFSAARGMVDQFIADIEAREVALSEDIGDKALEAAQTYGKIVSHPAQLNLGDCLAYACARGCRVKVAYKGDDFAHTDIGW